MESMNTSGAPSSRLKKWLRVFLTFIAIIVLLGLIVYGEENFRGHRAWVTFQNAEIAKGENFSPAHYIPPAIPDDQNFAMTPLLRPALDYHRHSTNGVQWRDTNAWQHLSDISIDLTVRGISAPKFYSFESASPIDLKAFAEFYRSNPKYPHSSKPGTAAEDVITALNKFAPDLQELREAAAARPLSRFPLEYDYEPPFAILLPHLAPIKGITLVCVLRAVAELDAHHTDEAWADLQVAFRLSDSVREEPFLIDHLVRVATLNLILQGVREGLLRHAWSDAQLAVLETNLAKIDLLTEYEHTMRGERSLNLSGVDYLRRTGQSAPDESGGKIPVLMPSGWFYQNMTLIGQSYRDYVLPAVDPVKRRVNTTLGDAMMSDLTNRRWSPYNLLANMLMPAISKAVQRSARAQTFLDETRLACASERYRLQHKQWPDDLAALAPQFIPAIPTDLFDGQPLRYKRDSKGGYQIYSIGWNGKDDGGFLLPASGPTGTDEDQGGRSHRVDPAQGDWVWSFPAP